MSAYTHTYPTPLPDAAALWPPSDDLELLPPSIVSGSTPSVSAVAVVVGLAAAGFPLAALLRFQRNKL